MSKGVGWHGPYYRFLNYTTGPIMILSSVPFIIANGVMVTRASLEMNSSPYKGVNIAVVVLGIGVVVTIVGWLSNRRTKSAPRLSSDGN